MQKPMQVRCVLNNPSCPYFPCGVVTLLQLPRTQNRRSAGPCRLSGTSTRNVLRKGAWLLPRSARPWLSRGSGSAAAVATMSSNAFRERWTCSVQSHNQNSCYTSSCWLCVLSARHQESRFNLIIGGWGAVLNHPSGHSEVHATQLLLNNPLCP